MTGMRREQFDAYYYSFMATGEPGVDAVLRAVAKAGKAYHHTERWSDCDKYEESQVDLIQAAADNAAATWRGGNAAAEQRGWDKGYDAGRRDERAELRNHSVAATRAYEQGQRDMLAKCIAAVKEVRNELAHPDWVRLTARDGAQESVNELKRIQRALLKKP